MPVVSILAFVSGFAIMAFQLVGGRMLSPFFGSSIHVWGSIITVFMIALALGYMLGGKWSLRDPTLRKLAMLFIATCALLAIVPVLDKPIMEWVFTLSLDPRYGALTACFVLFFPASLLMGMMQPYCVRLTVRNTRSSGSTAGTLSFVSTIGSALGTLITSFYLVALLEVSQIVYAIAITMLATAIFAIMMESSDHAPVPVTDE